MGISTFSARVCGRLGVGVDLVEGEGVGAEGDGAVGSDAGGHDADALLGVVDDFVRGTEDFDFPGVATGEVGELGVVVEVVDPHLHPVEFVATHGAYFPAHFPQERGHEEFAGGGDASAEDDKAVDEGDGGGNGGSERLAQLLEAADGGGLVARAVAFGYVVNVLGGELVILVAGQFAVHPPHGPDGNAVFQHDVGVLLVGEAERLDAGVVAKVEMAVDDDAYAEAGAEGVADEVSVLLTASGGPQLLVGLGQGAGKRLAVGVQVAVVVDEYRHSEFPGKERA